MLERLPEDKKILVEVLRQLVGEILPATCKEKLAYHVPFFYGRRRICLIWPGIRKDVSFGFCQGHRLQDVDQYLLHGTNKQVFYQIYTSPEEIGMPALKKLLLVALQVDAQFKV